MPKQVRIIRHLSVLAATLCFTPILVSVSAEELPVLEMSLEELMKLPVYSASKLGVESRDAPASVTIITRGDIERFGYRTLSEALTQVSGFYISSDHNYEYLGVRGISRPGDYNTRTLIMIDGHRLNDPVYSYAGIGEDFQLDMSDVERIEVTKGATSTVWGTSALLGVVNVITRKGRDIDGGDLGITYGSDDYRKGTAHVGKRYSDDLELAAGVSSMGSSGSDELFFKEFETSANGGGVAEHLDSEKARHGYFTGTYGEINWLFAQGWRKKEIPTASYDSAFNVDGAVSKDYTSRFEVGITHPFGADKRDGTLTGRVFYDYTSFFSDQPYESDPNNYVYSSKSSGKTLGGELRASRELAEGVQSVLGVEASRLFDLKFTNFVSSPRYEEGLDLNDSSALVALFTDLNFRISDTTHLIAGLRFDHQSDVPGDLSPRIGIIYSPDEATALKLIYGEGFRAPNNYEENYADGVLYVQRGELSPEKITDLEIGLERNFGKVEATLTLFRIELKDIISQMSNESGTLYFDNGDSAISRGVEAGVSGEVLNDLRMFANLCFAEAEESSTHLTNSPRITSSLGTSYELIRKKLTVSGRAHYIGERNSALGGEVPSDTKLDLITNLTISQSVKARFGIYNLLDRSLYSPSGEEHRQSKIPGDSRTYLVGVTYQW